MPEKGEVIPAFMTPQEAADLMRLSVRTLEGMRLAGTGPKYIKMGQDKRSKVVYRRTDIEDWMRDHEVPPKR